MLADYARTIAIFMIFGALIEIVAPSGSFKKYIRLILSLALIALLLEPVGALLSGEGAGHTLLTPQGEYGGAATLSRDEYERAQAGAVIAEYKKSLNAQAAQLVEARAGVKADVSVIVNEDYGSEEFAEILGVHVTAALPAGKEEQSALKTALLGNAANGEGAEDINETAELNIKNCLMDFYNIPDSNIHITVQGHVN